MRIDQVLPKWMRGVSVGALVSMVIFIGLALLFVGCGPFHRKNFDAESWKASPEQERAEMAGDLRRKLLADRPSRSEVIALLGEPGSGEIKGRYLSKTQLQTADTYLYYLGFWTGTGGWDATYLYVMFKDGDRVVDVKIDGF